MRAASDAWANLILHIDRISFRLRECAILLANLIEPLGERSSVTL